jgi:hypothetical protein
MWWFMTEDTEDIERYCGSFRPWWLLMEDVVDKLRDVVGHSG